MRADLDWNTPQQNQANAELIVQSVNSHAALVAACKALLDEAELYANEHRPKLTALCDKAREALRLAGDK
mgnify:CR=1 FL=1